MQMLSDSLSQYTSNHNQFDKLYCRLLIIRQEFKTQQNNCQVV